MNKKPLFLLIPFLVVINISRASANDTLTARASHLSLGLHLNQIRNEPGLGLSMTTPYFFDDKLALRFAGTLSVLYGIPLSNTSEEPLPYVNLRLGAVYKTGALAKAIRLYVHSGVIYISPDNEISDDERIGGYLDFGFEFFMSSGAQTRVSFCLESGFLASPAVAEKLPGQPVYALGVDLSVGIRYYF